MKGDARSAIVVLGAAVWPDEQPSPSLMRRAHHAVALYRQDTTQVIVGSGGVGKHPPSEAEIIKRIATSEGVPPENVLLESRSHSTLENVLFSARILREQSISAVTVVSDRYHLPRALMCFRALGFDAKGSGPDRAKTGTPLRKWIYYHVREVLALPWYATKLRALRESF